ncbi:peroxiredoxin-2E-1, chloroplastic-like [Phragmites australis]|uniref:peroxiredoxin-2E-1, chloroplastic-like n=1 Tax=Phragmites australis TaxID=29695 RepID=UPI002D77C5DD|nr:peroxiredoxin-2E-1, chloroplastic-like [Phragmites australis]XP_062179128.1 peroxiredoxin-2E-1, chloroplastic-like [Phragmites australis]
MATSALAALSATAAAGTRLLLSRPSPSSLSFASRRLVAAGPHRAGLLGAPRRAASSASVALAAIAVGDRLPDATLSYFDSPDGELKTVTVRDLTAGKKVVLFAVPGAFTPTCTQKHLPGFVAKAGELRAKGVDTVACVSVNDAFVMRAWKESLGVGDEVLLLSDGNGELTRAMCVELDLSDKPVGLGVRSRRYALLADDGVVKVLNLEDGGAFTNSSAEDMLRAL